MTNLSFVLTWWVSSFESDKDQNESAQQVWTKSDPRGCRNLAPLDFGQKNKTLLLISSSKNNNVKKVNTHVMKIIIWPWQSSQGCRVIKKQMKQKSNFRLLCHHSQMSYFYEKKVATFGLKRYLHVQKLSHVPKKNRKWPVLVGMPNNITLLLYLDGRLLGDSQWCW